jgi:hypothetical protein
VVIPMVSCLLVMLQTGTVWVLGLLVYSKMKMMLRLNCWMGWSKVGKGCSGFEIGLDVGYGEVGVTFWLGVYLWSTLSEFSQCPVCPSGFSRIPWLLSVYVVVKDP